MRNDWKRRPEVGSSGPWRAFLSGVESGAQLAVSAWWTARATTLGRAAVHFSGIGATGKVFQHFPIWNLIYSSPGDGIQAAVFAFVRRFCDLVC